jgi:hypothetical protein
MERCKANYSGLKLGDDWVAVAAIRLGRTDQVPFKMAQHFREGRTHVASVDGHKKENTKAEIRVLECVKVGCCCDDSWTHELAVSGKMSQQF